MAVNHLDDSCGLDLDELLSRVEGDYVLLQDIFEIFIEEFPKSLHLLNAALASNDLKKVQVSAHTMKGMFSTLAFVQASACAQRIEQLARAQQTNGIAEEVTYLEESAEAARSSLSKAFHRMN